MTFQYTKIKIKMNLFEQKLQNLYNYKYNFPHSGRTKTLTLELYYSNKGLILNYQILESFRSLAILFPISISLCIAFKKQSKLSNLP